MVRGWYHSSTNGQRLLSIDEIAEACCVSSPAVKQWFAEKIEQADSAGQQGVDAAEVVWFLVNNNMPVATSLLPPNSKKILLIASDEYVFQERCEKFDRICRFLSTQCNLLVETSAAGRAADLCLLTFSPNLVVILVDSCRQETINTFNLLKNFPEQKLLLIIDDAIKSDFERDLGTFPSPHMIVGDAQPVEELLPQLAHVFDK